MLSGGHYTGVVYCYILSITCICDAEWWPLYWCGLLLYIKYYLYKLYYMLSGGHYTGVVYCYILSITCINSTICDAEWWPLYRCGLLLYIKYYLYKL